MAEDSATNNAEKTRGRPFEPGNQYRIQPGEVRNPTGRPKKKPITEIYDAILEDPQNVGKIKAAVEAMLFSGRMAAQLQLKEMRECVEGKIVQQVEVSGDLHLTLSERMKKAEERVSERS